MNEKMGNFLKYFHFIYILYSYLLQAWLMERN